MKYRIIILLIFTFIKITNATELDSLINRLNNSIPDTEKINTLLHITQCLLDTNTDEAEKYIIDAMNLSLKEKKNIYIINSYGLYAFVLENKGEYSKALEIYNKVLKILDQNNHKDARAATYNNMAIIYDIIGRYNEALEYYFKSLELNIELNNTWDIAGINMNVGLLYYYLGNYKISVDYYYKALELFDKLHDEQGKANIYNNLGMVYDIQMNYNKALEYYNKSFEYFKNTDNLKAKSDYYNNIGLVYQNLNKPEIALENIKKSLAIRMQLGNVTGIAQCYENSGEINVELKNYDTAFVHLQKSLEIYRNIGDYNSLANIYKSIGYFFNLKKEYKKAISYLDSAYLSCDTTLYSETKKRIYLNYSVVYENMNDLENSLKYFKLYKEVNDSLQNSENTNRITQIELSYNFNKELDKKDLENKAEIKHQRLIRNSFIGGFILMLLLAFTMFRSYRIKRKDNILLAKQKKEIEEKNAELSQQKEEIEAQRDEIEAQRNLAIEQRDMITEQKNEITDSIHYARSIQNAVLPPDHYINEILSEYFILYKPRDIVSGDFYWINSKNDVTIIVAADCTGHGVPGAFMSMLGISLLNEIIGKIDKIIPAEILNQLREKVILSLNQNGKITEAKDGMDISLIAINTTPTCHSERREESMSGAIDSSPRNTEFGMTNVYNAQWAGANNPLWVIRPKSQVQRPKSQENLDTTWNLEFETCFLEFKGDKMPIAIYDKLTNFTNHEVELYSGDCIYLMSDGFQDQFGGRKNSRKERKFLSKNLKQLLASFSSGEYELSMDEQKSILATTFENWKGDIEQIDDVLVIGLRI